MHPIFNTPFGFFLTMLCFLAIFGLGWWLRGVMTKYNITSTLLREEANKLREQGNIYERAGNLDGYEGCINKADTLGTAAFIIESSRDTQDPGAGF